MQGIAEPGDRLPGNAVCVIVNKAISAVPSVLRVVSPALQARPSYCYYLYCIDAGVTRICDMPSQQPDAAGNDPELQQAALALPDAAEQPCSCSMSAGSLSLAAEEHHAQLRPQGAQDLPSVATDHGLSVIGEASHIPTQSHAQARPSPSMTDASTEVVSADEAGSAPVSSTRSAQPTGQELQLSSGQKEGSSSSSSTRAVHEDAASGCSGSEPAPAHSAPEGGKPHSEQLQPAPPGLFTDQDAAEPRSLQDASPALDSATPQAEAQAQGIAPASHARLLQQAGLQEAAHELPAVPPAAPAQGRDADQAASSNPQFLPSQAPDSPASSLPAWCRPAESSDSHVSPAQPCSNISSPVASAPAEPSRLSTMPGSCIRGLCGSPQPASAPAAAISGQLYP